MIESLKNTFYYFWGEKKEKDDFSILWDKAKDLEVNLKKEELISLKFFTENASLEEVKKLKSSLSNVKKYEARWFINSAIWKVFERVITKKINLLKKQKEIKMAGVYFGWMISYDTLVNNLCKSQYRSHAPCAIMSIPKAFRVLN